MKLHSVKTFEAVQLPNNFSSYFTIAGQKAVNEITLVDNAYVLVVQGNDHVLIPLSNVCYANPLQSTPQPAPETIQELKETQDATNTEKTKTKHKRKE